MKRILIISIIVLIMLLFPLSFYLDSLDLYTKWGNFGTIVEWGSFVVIVMFYGLVVWAAMAHHNHSNSPYGDSGL